MATITQLQSVVNRLHRDRQAHVDAVAAIDAAFERLGVGAGRAKKRGRRAGGRKKTAGRKTTARPKGRTGKRYSVPGPESILRFVKAAPKAGRTGAEIDMHWKKEGRAGSCYKILGELVKVKKIKRENIKGQRGSRYRVA